MLHSTYQKIWKTQQWSQDWKRSVFITIPKKGNTKECSNYCTIALISHAAQNPSSWDSALCELKTSRCISWIEKRQKNQKSNCQHSLAHRAREFPKNIYFCFTDYTKSFDCVDHNKLWTILKEMGISDHYTCLLRNLYAGQEAEPEVRTRHGKWTSSKSEKEYIKAVCCYPSF